MASFLSIGFFVFIPPFYQKPAVLPYQETAVSIVGTLGTEVDKPSLTVGNGLCAVPLRGNYNPCGQTGTTYQYVIPSERSESRNLPKWQVLSCGYFLSHVVDSSTPLALRSE